MDEKNKKGGIAMEIVVKLYFGQHILWAEKWLCKMHKKIKKSSFIS